MNVANVSVLAQLNMLLAGVAKKELFWFFSLLVKKAGGNRSSGQRLAG